MISLVIDTTSKKVIVALLNDLNVIIEKIEVSDKSLSIEFTSLVKEVFDESGLTPQDVDDIYVAVGPGSFTGIRVGVTYAKVMAWSLKKRIVPFSSLELFATTKAPNNFNAAMIDARRDYVYAGLYDKNLNIVIPEQYLTLSEFLCKLEQYSSINFISNDQFDLDITSPNYDVSKIVERHKREKGLNPHQIKPNYLKKTEAEQKLNG